MGCRGWGDQKSGKREIRSVCVEGEGGVRERHIVQCDKVSGQRRGVSSPVRICTI